MKVKLLKLNYTLLLTINKSQISSSFFFYLFIYLFFVFLFLFLTEEFYTFDIYVFTLNTTSSSWFFLIRLVPSTLIEQLQHFPSMQDALLGPGVVLWCITPLPQVLHLFSVQASAHLKSRRQFRRSVTSWGHRFQLLHWSVCLELTYCSWCWRSLSQDKVIFWPKWPGSLFTTSSSGLPPRKGPPPKSEQRA